MPAPGAPAPRGITPSSPEEGGPLPAPTSQPLSADAQEPQGAAAQRVPQPAGRRRLSAASRGLAPASPPPAASLPHAAGPARDLPAGGASRPPAAAPRAAARRALRGLERRRLFVPASARDCHLRIVPDGPRRERGAPPRAASPTPGQGLGAERRGEWGTARLGSARPRTRRGEGGAVPVTAALPSRPAAQAGTAPPHNGRAHL